MTIERTDTTAVATTPSDPSAETEPRNLPAATGTTALATLDPATERRWRQTISVAFLPLAIATLLVIAFAMALWTFLATTS